MFLRFLREYLGIYSKFSWKFIMLNKVERIKGRRIMNRFNLMRVSSVRDEGRNLRFLGFWKKERKTLLSIIERIRYVY
jgi:hypothetical protein